tara:strand:- start:2640 stop:2855 length:216 start_codon:yes stop_codon:yes gene_type:complete
MKDVSPAEIFKAINNLKKSVRDLHNKSELSSINRDKIWVSLNELNSKSSRLEKLVVVLAVIQTLTLFLGVL